MTTKRDRPAGANGRAANGAATNTANSRQYTTNRLGIEVRRADGRIVGELRGGMAHGYALTKHAKREHMLQRPVAWVWDDCILDAAERAGARFTEIKCDGLIYRASLSDFRRIGFPVNRGHGSQRGLPLGFWHVRRAGEPPAAVQWRLFEAMR